MGKAKKLKKRSAKVIRDRHILYNAAVQSVDADIDFFQRVYKRKRGKPFRLLKEDFCGTAALSCTWVKRDKKNEAWGVDLDQPTLDWGIKHYVPTLILAGLAILFFALGIRGESLKAKSAKRRYANR